MLARHSGKAAEASQLNKNTDRKVSTRKKNKTVGATADSYITTII